MGHRKSRKRQVSEVKEGQEQGKLRMRSELGHSKVFATVFTNTYCKATLFSGSYPALQVQRPMGTIHSPSPLQYNLMGTSTSSAFGMHVPRAITREVLSAPVIVSGKMAKFCTTLGHFLKKTLTDSSDIDGVHLEEPGTFGRLLQSLTVKRISV
ncbi:Hypothetical predicted protein [Podarcis lilfordi]|uniref:Uncharacterized protein n=1 Tax=Podarcis lilfordi TaxID=74358 RepID=A0AA35P8D1_9SAUR|nr:Hypothetical predicted protein [Podarcis lilfordi]